MIVTIRVAQWLIELISITEQENDMEAILVALGSVAAAGAIAFLGRQLCLATVRLDVLRDQRRRAGRRAAPIVR